MATRAPEPEGRRSATAARRRVREREILAATRSLFDERGVREAQIEDIARAVGINRAIVYRHFTGKEELFALALVGYLDELPGAAVHRRPGRARRGAARAAGVGVRRLRRGASGVRRLRPEPDAPYRHRAPGRDLRGRDAPPRARDRRLPGHPVGALEAGVDAGDFTVADPTLLANTLYATGLGGLQLARVGLVINESAPGVPRSARSRRSRCAVPRRLGPRPGRPLTVGHCRWSPLA